MLFWGGIQKVIRGIAGWQKFGDWTLEQRPEVHFLVPLS
jgi:hypothetical protein